MRQLSFILLALIYALSATVAAQTPAVTKTLTPDVRVLIDVSGSMKKTDPQNLRKPALELLVQLIPEGSKAGVWTFGKSVNLLTPHQIVDDSWRKNAATKTNEITSVALFTNIGAALEAATYDRNSLNPNFRHNIILLTDGVLDISKNPEENAVERNRVLETLLPQLTAAGYVVHTIALSDAADQELMKEISIETDGMFAVAQTADELMSTFLRIFDQAVPAERLPLENNSFLVDGSVEEFTALIFRKMGASPTVLIAPSGDEYVNANEEKGIHWYKSNRYDLITVQKPQEGEWRVQADFDPDNRVTVVSNLQLQVSALKNNLMVDQPLDVQFHFQEDNKVVTNKTFLELLEVNAWVKKNNDNNEWKISLGGAVPEDGIFIKSLESFNAEGNYNIRLLVDGKTFKREFKHNLSVISPFSVKSEKIIDGENVNHIITVTPDQQLIHLEKTTVFATIQNSEGSNDIQKLMLTDAKNWQLTVTPTVAADYTIDLQVKGVRKGGAAFAETLPPQQFKYPEANDPEPQPVLIAPESPTVGAPELEIESPNEEPINEEPIIEAPVKESNNWLLYAGILFANLIVFGLAYVAYKMFISSKKSVELSELESTQAAPVTKQSKAPPTAESKPTMQEIDNSSASGIDLSVDAHISGADKKPTLLNEDFLADLDDINPKDDHDK